MKALIQTFSIVLSLTFAAGCSQAGPAEMQVVDYGLYQASNESSLLDSNSPTGVVRTGGTFKLLQQTNVISAKVGNAFGFRFLIPKEFQTPQLKYVYLFPEMRNANTGQAFSRSEVFGERKGHGPESGIFYNLTDPWELVPGEWTIQVFAHDRKLLERQFILVKDD